MSAHIFIHNNVKKLSLEIAEKAVRESAYFPVDRVFLQAYMERIVNVHYLEFILFNAEMVNPTYTNQLFLCLPELWEKVVYEDFQQLTEQFTNAFSYFVLIQFTHKYLEIDILEMMVNKSIVKGFYPNVKQYLLAQANTIIMTSEEMHDLEYNEGKEYLGYDAGKWSYITQRLLTNKKIKKAKRNYSELKVRIDELVN